MFGATVILNIKTIMVEIKNYQLKTFLIKLDRT